jgi:hypothetical protein
MTVVVLTLVDLIVGASADVRQNNVVHPAEREARYFFHAHLAVSLNGSFVGATNEQYTFTAGR